MDEKNFAVVLNPEAAQFYPASMGVLLNHNDEGTRYFLAKSIDPNGVYFFLELEQQIEGKKHMIQLHLHHSHVLYVLAGADAKMLGFIPG